MEVETRTKAADSTSDQKPDFAIYQRMLLFLFVAASGVIAVLLVLIFAPSILASRDDGQAPPAQISTFLLVVLAGTLGAFFSALQRLYDFKDLPAVVFNSELGHGSLYLFAYSLVPALVGGMAAAALYLIFAGGLLSGSFFPAFSCKSAPCESLDALLEAYGPSQAVDYAKALLWGFVAGFAERLVPDLLGNFVGEAEKTNSKYGPTAQSKTTSNAAGGGDGWKRPMSAPATASRGIANEID